VHRFDWEHVLIDLRCIRCKRSEIAAIYMVRDELWVSSGLDGWPCFRCFEEAISLDFASKLVPVRVG
jgi:hypothetical protein